MKQKLHAVAAVQGLCLSRINSEEPFRNAHNFPELFEKQVADESRRCANIRVFYDVVIWCNICAGHAVATSFRGVDYDRASHSRDGTLCRKGNINKFPLFVTFLHTKRYTSIREYLPLVTDVYGAKPAG